MCSLLVYTRSPCCAWSTAKRRSVRCRTNSTNLSEVGFGPGEPLVGLCAGLGFVWGFAISALDMVQANPCSRLGAPGDAFAVGLARLRSTVTAYSHATLVFLT